MIRSPMNAGRVEGPGGVWSEWKLITQEIARDWLQRGPDRPTRVAVSEEIARKMRSGRYVDHCGILWGANGQLLDGRNRLMAIAEAGVSIWMLVVYGINGGREDFMQTRDGCDA